MRGSEVHRDAAVREREAATPDRGAYARTALAHRCVGKADDVGAWKLGADADLDLDGRTVDAEERRAENARQGGLPRDRGGKAEGRAPPSAEPCLPLLKSPAREGLSYRK
jgi:hypothetical protein